MARRRGATTVSELAGDLLKYLADYDFIRKVNVKDDAEDVAKTILMKRAKGDAEFVTDMDMEMADDQFMYDFTPLDMSTQARLKRAKDAKFTSMEDLPYVHGTMEGEMQQFHDFPAFGSRNPAVSETYTSNRPNAEGATLIPYLVKMPDDVVHIDNYGRNFEAVNPFALDKTSGRRLDEVMSHDGQGGLLGRINHYYGDVRPLEVDPKELAHMSEKELIDNEIFQGIVDKNRLNVGYPASTDTIADAMPSSKKEVVKIDNIIDVGGVIPKDPAIAAARRNPSENIIVSNATRMRSPFARFDPEFKHLRNLSASVLPASVGMAQLLQKPEVTEEEIEEYLSGLGS